MAFRIVATRSVYGEMVEETVVEMLREAGAIEKRHHPLANAIRRRAERIATGEMKPWESGLNIWRNR